MTTGGTEVVIMANRVDLGSAIKTLKVFCNVLMVPLGELVPPAVYVDARNP